MRTRCALLGLVLLATAPGCARRFFVRPSQLQRAQQTGGAVIPALTNDREPTFLEVDAIRRMEMLDATGLQAVRARDARNFLRTTGWISTAIGVIFGSFGLPFLLDSPPSGSDEETLGTVFTAEAAVHLAVGIPFLALGYASDGAEEPGPSPGMPLTLNDP